uniref:Uncharacterized protein n=1 Tax=Anguilla anguilla TaxID=7936 RepID=A0A0E9RYS3_ANGAN
MVLQCYCIFISLFLIVLCMSSTIIYFVLNIIILQQ